MYTQPKNCPKRIIISVITMLCLCAAFAGFVLQAATKKRVFDGKLSVKVCKKLANGQWQELDKITAPISFEASVTEVASGKIYETNQRWYGTSEKGRRFDSQLGGRGTASADITSGRIDLKTVPLKIVIDGKQETLLASLSTEGASAPNGESLPGKRAKIIGRQAEVAVAGFTAIKSNVIEEKSAGGTDTKALAEKKQTQELIFLIRAEGRLTAK